MRVVVGEVADVRDRVDLGVGLAAAGGDPIACREQFNICKGITPRPSWGMGNA